MYGAQMPRIITNNKFSSPIEIMLNRCGVKIKKLEHIISMLVHKIPVNTVVGLHSRSKSARPV